MCRHIYAYLTGHTLLAWQAVGLFLLLSPLAMATHQVGGHIEMRALDATPGRYRITVTHYVENNQAGRSQSAGRLGIFRKRDNVQMLVIQTAVAERFRSVVFTNTVCASQRNLDFMVAIFEAYITIDPATYADPDGYYISYQTRNRNAGINNIEGALDTGYTFYLEFPALRQNSQPFLNSSPNFPNLNGEYICLNQPFTYAFGGTDPDGDELRYSMITPLDDIATGRGGGGGGGGGGNTNVVSGGPYPTITWKTGYSAANAIPGSPALGVNSSTGELTVTATELGLFVFAVKVEEYRNGVKIGEVRRDFQLLVVDCPGTLIPKAVVRAEANPTTETSFTICPAAALTLVANTNPDWNYQWQRNGVNLPDATDPALLTSETGRYVVVVSSKSSCINSSLSQPMSVSVHDMDASLANAGHLCAYGGTVSLSVAAAPGQTYQWFVNGQPMPGATGTTAQTQQPVVFQVEVTNTRFGCKLKSNEWRVERSAPVQATISSSQTALCPAATMPLTGGGGVRYQWQVGQQSLPETSSLLTAQTAGTYTLTAIDQYDCIGLSEPLAIGQIAPISVTMEPVVPSCGTAAPTLSLVGAPANGLFAGPGVAGSAFSPALAGLGTHALTYTVRPAPWCDGVVAQQTAVVDPIPTIALPDTIKTWRSNTFTIEPGLTGNPTQFAWTPATYLSSPNVAVAEVNDIWDTITYQLHVANVSGCEATTAVVVRVYERIWVPDAFSPNQDGQNDVWELKGAEGFTKAEITVFNRWGEVVFWSAEGYKEPFNGTWRGQPLPVGPYAYVLKPAPNQPALRGRVLLLR